MGKSLRAGVSLLKRYRGRLKFAAGFLFFLAVVGSVFGPPPLQVGTIAYIRYETGRPTAGDLPLVRFAALPRDEAVVGRVQRLVNAAEVGTHTQPGVATLPRQPQVQAVMTDGRTLSFHPAWRCSAADNCQPETAWVIRQEGQGMLPVYAPDLAAYLAQDARADYPLQPPMALGPRSVTPTQDLTVVGHGFTCRHVVLWAGKKRDTYIAADDPNTAPTPGAIRLADLEPQAGEWSWSGPLLLSPWDYLIIAKGDGALDGQPCSAVLPVTVDPEPQPPKPAT